MSSLLEQFLGDFFFVEWEIAGHNRSEDAHQSESADINSPMVKMRKAVKVKLFQVRLFVLLCRLFPTTN